MDNRTIAHYYDVTLPFYKRFWYRDSESYALHYGLWERGTKDINEALLNTNKFMAREVRVKPGDRILDAGCGIGGSSIWLAKNFDVNVIGITISKTQLQKARELSKTKLLGKTGFFLKDFLRTGFPNNSFDVVWAIESVCHAERKRDFMEEAYRILKPGGRLIVADGLLKRKARNEREKEIINVFTEGLALPNLAGEDVFKKEMRETGFTKVRLFDKTKEILPSSIRIHDMCKSAMPFTKAASKINRKLEVILKNNLAGIAQLEAVKNGLAGYGIFYGEKPLKK